MVYARSLPFGVCVEMESGEEQNAIMKSDSFAGLIRDILRFYETGKPCFDTNETINVMKLREGALRALETPGNLGKIKVTDAVCFFMRGICNKMQIPLHFV